MKGCPISFLPKFQSSILIIKFKIQTVGLTSNNTLIIHANVLDICISIQYILWSHNLLIYESYEQAINLKDNLEIVIELSRFINTATAQVNSKDVADVRVRQTN